MADELLAKLTSTQLPALPSSPEPAEPAAPPSTEPEVGRTPEEVVGEREARADIPAEAPEETTLPAGKQAKTKPVPTEVKTYDIDGVTYTFKALEEKGLLEKVIQPARQFEPLQKKYLETLETVKGVARGEQQPATQEPPKQITNLDIARVYDPTAKLILQDLISGNLMEPELSEAYPRAMQTMLGQMRYAFDEMFQQKAKLDTAIERLEQTISYLNANRQKTEGQSVAQAYNAQLDALAKKDAKLFAGLSDSKIREQFTAWLVDEVKPSVAQTEGAKGLGFLERQWIAYNAPTVLKSAQTAQGERNGRQDKRFATGETGGSRPSAPPEESTLLDRLVDRSGRIKE